MRLVTHSRHPLRNSLVPAFRTQAMLLVWPAYLLGGIVFHAAGFWPTYRVFRYGRVGSLRMAWTGPRRIVSGSADAAVAVVIEILANALESGFRHDSSISELRERLLAASTQVIGERRVALSDSVVLTGIEASFENSVTGTLSLTFPFDVEAEWVAKIMNSRGFRRAA